MRVSVVGLEIGKRDRFSPNAKHAGLIKSNAKKVTCFVEEKIEISKCRRILKVSKENKLISYTTTYIVSINLKTVDWHLVYIYK